MNIVYHESSKTFHLWNDNVSYVMGILPNGKLGQYYYGGKVRDRENFDHYYESTHRSASSFPVKSIPGFSPEFTRQEYPDFGTSDFREPGYVLVQENGSRISNFSYAGYRILSGKPHLPGLPQAYTEDDAEAMTLEVDLADDVTGVVLTLHYTIYRDYPIITRSACFTNKGDSVVKLDKAMSVSIDFPDYDFIWMQFSGAWGREREPQEKDLRSASGMTAIGSLRGHSSSQQNPFVILKRPETTENSGEAYGFTFVYSGNFLAQAEADTYDSLRFSMGIHPETFCWKLEPEESFQTPEVIMNYTISGLNGLSGIQHRFLRSRVARGPWRDKGRPVLLNNWEATGMDFTEDSVLQIARKGAEVGVELFVLDDGWFGARNDDHAGLGDWYPNKEKLPGGVKQLADKINNLGLDFGIWIEPEMINEDSDLFRAHPEYVLRVPERPASLGRNQLVLDWSNPEVVDYIFDMLMKSFEGANISYIKWDMNRSITECYSSHWPADRQGEVYHRYILGVYHFYEKLLAAFPDILIESCASGGCRFDAGILYYAPQAWCSDDTDAAERVSIQYGSSYGYPISSWGSHVSECPNQQTGRMTPLSTRANVAFFGAFGYEMDLNSLNEEEIELVKEQVAFMKENRELIQFGSFYRLMSPKTKKMAAWMVVNEDKTRAIVGLYKLMSTVNTGFYHIKLTGLDPEKDYRIEEVDEIMGGDELMQAGFFPQGDPSANPGALHPDTDMKADMDLVSDYCSKLYCLTAL